MEEKANANANASANANTNANLIPLKVFGMTALFFFPRPVKPERVPALAARLPFDFAQAKKSCPQRASAVRGIYGAQSAMKTLISCGDLALRLEMKTSFLPSGENCGKALKPPAAVMRSMCVPSRSMA